MKKICICVPTKDRPGMLKDVLDSGLEHYKQAGIDVAIFDSSENDETKSLIDGYKGRGFDNISYHRTDPNNCIDYKIINIWKEHFFLRNYKYIWLINDSISIYPDALGEINRYLDDDYTMIRLPVEGSGSKEDIVTTDINTWFGSCSKGMAHMASTIMSTKLLDDTIDWDELRERYVGDDDIYSSNHGFFFTVGFYLERIATIKDFRGVLIGNRRKWRRDSALKQGNSYWNSLVFEVWAKSYPDTIMKTPKVYLDKERVIKESDNILFGRFERQSLISFRIRGLFSEEVCERYRDYWKYVSTLNYDELLEIAKTPVEELKNRYGETYGMIDKWSDNLSEIERSIGHGKIVVYGAGLYGEYVVCKLIADGYRDSLIGIAVSDSSENVETINGIAVRNIDDYEADKTSAVIIIATLPDTAKAIRNILEQKGYKNIKQIF